uniref:Uncharacterized mitochondrial protein AtMg00810-like n=1 Tax=Tanacetum cinerariifolium TaxID=118510 RepID=A0A699HW73_TANCI|nr:uncharacterized mitochondrial protein AtMg00810-like [Tanacetum cinerariifolium]
MSSAEAECVVAAGCCAQVIWIKSQLADYDVLYDKVPIFCDNTSVIAISNNPVLHSRTKHIDIRETSPSIQVADIQSTKEPVATTDITQSIDAFESAEEQENQLGPANAKKEDHDKATDSGIRSLGDVRLEDLSVNVEESPFDIESEIEVVKKWQPPNKDDDVQITFLGPIYDGMETDQKADSDHVNLSKSEEALPNHLLDELDELARTKSAPLDDFADKTADSNPLSHLRKEISSLTTKAIAEFVKQVIKPMNKQFKAFNKLECTSIYFECVTPYDDVMSFFLNGNCGYMAPSPEGVASPHNQVGSSPEGNDTLPFTYAGGNSYRPRQDSNLRPCLGG